MLNFNEQQNISKKNNSAQWCIAQSFCTSILVTTPRNDAQNRVESTLCIITWKWRLHAVIHSAESGLRAVMHSAESLIFANPSGID
jgi:hypothetical protein